MRGFCRPLLRVISKRFSGNPAPYSPIVEGKHATEDAKGSFLFGICPRQHLSYWSPSALLYFPWTVLADLTSFREEVSVDRELTFLPLSVVCICLNGGVPQNLIKDTSGA